MSSGLVAGSSLLLALFRGNRSEIAICWYITSDFEKAAPRARAVVRVDRLEENFFCLFRCFSVVLEPGRLDRKLPWHENELYDFLSPSPSVISSSKGRARGLTL